MGWFNNATRKRRQSAVRALCDSVFARAQSPAPYLAGWVADTLDSRFEWSALHAGLVLGRLNGAGHEGAALAPLLVDEIFSRYDYSLRETGVGDTVIAKKVRALGERFYGLAAAVQAGLADNDAPGALTAVLVRNGLAPGHEGDVGPYLRDCAGALKALSDANICSGKLDWPAFPIDRLEKPL